MPRSAPRRKIRKRRIGASRILLKAAALASALHVHFGEPLLGPVHLGYLGWPGGETRKRDGYNALIGCRYENGEFAEQLPKLDWVICGGESGGKARPMHPEWARSLYQQCKAAGVPFLFKQWGEWAPGEAFGLIQDGPVHTRNGDVRDWMKRYVVCADRADRLDGHSFTEHATDLVYRVGKKRAGRLLDGATYDGFPEVRAA
jgi:hypothetical protein